MINQTRIILNSIWSNGGILSRCLIWIPSVALGLVLAGCAGSPPRTPEPPPAPVPVVQKKPPRLGLALGGGAARGFAHIGVIQVLEEPPAYGPDLVVGTSAGSLVAALYASWQERRRTGNSWPLTMDEGAITDWAFPSSARMIRGEALARFVREHTSAASPSRR
jgi:NTE family protein